MPQLPLISIVGPTAVGKTRLGLHIAKSIGAEILSADSRQVYRQMDIGTAKPSLQEQSQIFHHLLNLRNPDEDYNIAIFIQHATTVMEEIRERNKIPLVVGGTGQYIWGLIERWEIPRVPPNQKLRSDLELQAERRGPWALYQLLKAVSPKTAMTIDSKNTRRIIRALEIHFSKGKKPIRKDTAHSLTDRSLVIGLTTDRKELYRRIDLRVDHMMRRGFVEEVKTLLNNGYSTDLPSMSGIGYKEIAAHLKKGTPSIEEVIQRIKYRTHALARNQYSWFRLQDPRINWINANGKELDVGLEVAQRFLHQCAKIEH